MLVGVSFVSPMYDCNILLDHIHSSILDDIQFAAVSPLLDLTFYFSSLVWFLLPIHHVRTLQPMEKAYPLLSHLITRILESLLVVL